MIDFMMAVNRYCAECMKNGQFLPLRFVMMNLTSGVWVCSKDECVFPMNSPDFSNYMEENMTSEKVLLLTKSGRRTHKVKKSKYKHTKGLSATKLKMLSAANHSPAVSSHSHTSEENSIQSGTYSSSDTTTISLLHDDQQHLKNSFPLWKNEGLLCWLDVILSMLVLNKTLNELCAEKPCADSFVTELCCEYQKILSTFEKQTSYLDVKPSLDQLRKRLLNFLQPKLLADFTETESPLCLLSLVLDTDASLKEQVETSHNCVFKCSGCGFEKKDEYQKAVLSMPNTSEDLSFPDNLSFSRSCYLCFRAQQTSRYEIQRYPRILYVHFKEGVRSKNYWHDYNFTTTEGDRYHVTQVIQYISSKKHFVLWSYSIREKLWLCADDLTDPVVSYKYTRPKCRPQEVQMLVWERYNDLDYTTNLNIDRLPLVSHSNDVPLSSPSDSVYSTVSWDGSRKSSSKPSSLCSIDSPLPSPLMESATKMSKHLTKDILSAQRFKPYIPKSKSRKDDNTATSVGLPGTESMSLEEQRESKEVAKLPSIQTQKVTSFDAMRSILSEELDGCYDELVSKHRQDANTDTDAPTRTQASVQDASMLETLMNDHFAERNVSVDVDVEVSGTLPSVDFHMDTSCSVDRSPAEFSLDDIL